MGFVEMIPKKLYVGGKISFSDWQFNFDNITAIINLRNTPDFPRFNFSGRIIIWSPLN